MRLRLGPQPTMGATEKGRLMRKPKLIYYNDARHYLMYRYDPPMSLHRLCQPVDEVLGTGVDTLSFGLASGQTFLHDSKVGLKWGERIRQHNHGAMWWRAAENLDQALKAGHDPLKVVVDRAHEKGIQLLCSLRINDAASPSGDNLYMVGGLKFEKPELMIGEDDPDRPGAASAMDFAKSEVREERLQVIEEVCDRYGADGLEIDDYIRVFFKPGEARKNTPVLTNFMSKVRDLLDRIGRKRGEQLMLACRVHHMEEANLAVGMDVRTWLSAKLVDLVIPCSGGPETSLVDTNPYARWLVDAAHEAGAWVHAMVGRTPYDDRYHVPTLEMYRAALVSGRAAGLDGLYMADLPWPHTAKEYMILREMGDPDICARKPKHYILGPHGPGDTRFQRRRYLPTALEEGQPARAVIFVGDQLDSARAEGALAEVKLGVRIVQTCPQDRLSFRLNGLRLCLEEARAETYYGGLVSYMAARSGLPERIDTHYWFEFSLPLDLVREGENQLEVTMEHRFNALTAERVLQSVELHIAYDDPPVPVQGQM